MKDKLAYSVTGDMRDFIMKPTVGAINNEVSFVFYSYLFGCTQTMGAARVFWWMRR